MTKFKVAKGVRDWNGKDAILRNFIRDNLKNVFEKYGYNPLETPMIERLDTISFKGGSEIQKEVFKLSDQGKRKLALRFDQTVPISRFISCNPNIKLPFKRYVVGEVFRDGPAQPEQGRYRIFTQCDVDIFGVSEMTAETELFMLARDAFNELELGDVKVKINNRKLLDGILDYCGVSKLLKIKAIIILDKLDKIGIKGVKKELNSLLKKDIIKKLLDLISINNLEVLGSLDLNETGKEGLAEIKELLDYCKKLKLDFVFLDLSLARGLDYYTGTVFEVFLKGFNSAILGGGRYDNMLKAFSGRDIPAVGFSFGLERIALVMKKKFSSSVTDIYLIPIGDVFSESLKIADKLRKKGLKIDINLIKARNIRKCISYADSQGIPYVGFIGAKEIKEKVVKLKNLKTGKEISAKINEIKKKI